MRRVLPQAAERNDPRMPSSLISITRRKTLYRWPCITHKFAVFANQVGNVLTKQASCSCGALKVVTQGQPLKVSVCHCDACKRRTGSSFGVGVFYASESIEILGPSATFRRLGDSGKSLEFHFCPTCGSTVFWRPDFRPGLTAVALGCFDDAEGLGPSQAVYNESRHPWVMLDLGQA